MLKEKAASPKILLVGPYPPPHGGISVHLRNAHARLASAGTRCHVLNTAEGVRWKTIASLMRYAWEGWTVHLHTNGHNPKSWVVALAGGVAARIGEEGTLTLHSGFVPEFLHVSGPVKRRLARLVCALYSRVICVSPAIADAVASLGISRDKLEIRPAYIPAVEESVSTPPHISAWMQRRTPLVSTTLSFRPEYGFELLVDAIERLRSRHRQIGCLVMGDGEQRQAAAELLDRRGLTEAVFLAGDVGHALCISLISQSDVFVRTTYQDGDAISVREALTAGVPVVASNVGTRPSGVALFEAGHLDGLLRALNAYLEVEANVRSQVI